MKASFALSSNRRLLDEIVILQLPFLMHKMEGGGKSKIDLSEFYLSICYRRRDGMIAQYNLTVLTSIQKQTLKAKINSPENEKLSESVIKYDITKFIISRPVMLITKKMLPKVLATVLEAFQKCFGKQILFFLECFIGMFYFSF